MHKFKSGHAILRIFHLCIGTWTLSSDTGRLRSLKSMRHTIIVSLFARSRKSDVSGRPTNVSYSLGSPIQNRIVHREGLAASMPPQLMSIVSGSAEVTAASTQGVCRARSGARHPSPVGVGGPSSRWFPARPMTTSSQPLQVCHLLFSYMISPYSRNATANDSHSSPLIV